MLQKYSDPRDLVDRVAEDLGALRESAAVTGKIVEVRLRNEAAFD